MSHSIIPAPRVALTFRVGTMADIPWMDALQKQFGDALGFFKTQMYVGYVKLGAVLIAEVKETADYTDGTDRKLDLNSSAPSAKSAVKRLGFCISRDRYLKRDELGVVFQLCVDPKIQRGYIGAAIVREVFARSAYGCRLYCLWCAQDLKANEFWEAMGFTPIAFRSGSDKKRRVHIFWQKKIVDADVETKWWYPFQTTGGAIRADRLVFPIPDGVHWRDVRAVELPVNDVARASSSCLPEPKKITGKMPVPRKKIDGPAPMGGFRFQSELEVEPVKTKRVRAAGAASAALASKIDPAFLAAGRELRDRWLEHVNAEKGLLESSGKYDVVRQRHLSATAPRATPLLPAA